MRIVLEYHTVLVKGLFIYLKGIRNMSFCNKKYPSEVIKDHKV